MEQLEGEFEKPLPVDTAELHAIPDSDDNVEEPTPTGDPNPAPKGTWQILTAHLMEHTMLEEFTNDEDFPDALPLTKAYGVPAHMSKVGILRMCFNLNMLPTAVLSRGSNSVYFSLRLCMT